MHISTISIIGILVSALLPIVFTGYAKFAGKGYSNAAPRDFIDKLEGKRKRAYFAHLNSFEAFPFFAVAVIIAHVNQVNSMTIDTLVFIHVLNRILYGVFYIFDMANLRSIVWTIALACNISLLLLSMN